MKSFLLYFLVFAAPLASATGFNFETVEQMREVLKERRALTEDGSLSQRVRIRKAEVALMKIIGEKKEFSNRELLMEIQKFDQSGKEFLQSLAEKEEWPLTQAFLELQQAYQQYRIQNYPGSPSSHNLVTALRRYNRSVHKKRQTQEEPFFWPYIGLGTESGLLRPMNSPGIDFSDERKEPEFYWSLLDARWKYLEFLKRCSHWLR